MNKTHGDLNGCGITLTSSVRHKGVESFRCGYDMLCVSCARKRTDDPVAAAIREQTVVDKERNRLIEAQTDMLREAESIRHHMDARAYGTDARNTDLECETMDRIEAFRAGTKEESDATDERHLLKMSLDASRKIRRYVAFVLTGDKESDCQVAADDIVTERDKLKELWGYVDGPASDAASDAYAMRHPDEEDEPND